MRLHHHGHSCVRLELEGATLVIDCGSYSDPQALAGADAVLYTHGHPDHLALEPVRNHRASSPGTEVWAPAGVARTLTDEGFEDVGVLSPGSTVTVAGVDVQVLGGRHAEVLPEIDAGENVALLLPGRILHPGDSFEVSGIAPGDVDVLLLPVQGPWLRLAYPVRLARAVAPRVAVPIHDAVLNELGRASADRIVSGALGTIGYERLAPGAHMTL